MHAFVETAMANMARPGDAIIGAKDQMIALKCVALNSKLVFCLLIQVRVSSALMNDTIHGDIYFPLIIHPIE